MPKAHRAQVRLDITAVSSHNAHSQAQTCGWGNGSWPAAYLSAFKFPAATSRTRTSRIPTTSACPQSGQPSQSWATGERAQATLQCGKDQLRDDVEGLNAFSMNVVVLELTGTQQAKADTPLPVSFLLPASALRSVQLDYGVWVLANQPFRVSQRTKGAT